MFFIRLVQRNSTWDINSLVDVPLGSTSHKEAMDAMQEMRPWIDSSYQLEVIEKNGRGELTNKHGYC